MVEKYGAFSKSSSFSSIHAKNLIVFMEIKAFFTRYCNVAYISVFPTCVEIEKSIEFCEITE